MSEPLYPTIETAWQRILERRWGVVLDEPYAVELLTVSAGLDSTAIAHYRAWYVGAKLIEQDLSTQAITEADGAKFTRLQPVIDSLLQAQRQYDEANNLIIPTGYEATPAKCDPCGTSLVAEVGLLGTPRKPRTIQTLRV